MVFAIWVAHRLQLQEDFVIHENVPGFTPSLFKQVLPMYIVETTLIDVASSGVPNERVRRITVLRHQRTVKLRIDRPGHALIV